MKPGNSKSLLPEHYRARIEVIRGMLSTLAVNEKGKVNEIVLLRNGVFPEQYNEYKLIQENLLKNTYKNEPLTFSELTRFNTWFTIHPEKICGEEQVTTSLEFPIKVKGTREDIIRIIRGNEHISNLEMQTLATEVELQLLQL